MRLARCLATLLACLVGNAVTLPHGRNDIFLLQKTAKNATIIKLGDISYLLDTGNPKLDIRLSGISVPGLETQEEHIAVTVIVTNATTITESLISSTLEQYLAGDDVYNEDFLQGIIVRSLAPKARLDDAAVRYLNSLELELLMVDQAFSIPKSLKFHRGSDLSNLSPGPYIATSHRTSLSLSSVYRLYDDSFRDFLYGTYLDSRTENYDALDISYPGFGYPATPVPSRLYSLLDDRPMAGFRVAVKDLFDMEGLITTGGSRALAHIRSPANITASSIQRIVEPGGILVGKYKLAQFASGANPWDWQDEHYPFNPRGDGWLTCSAFSSGGGCGIAAYDWLDFAIGTDTGSSMRRPAAVSGTYGQRPSQGMMLLDGVIPLGAASDTAGVFSRDPKKWTRFSKHWYAPDLRQNTNTTGLSELVVPQSGESGFPKTLLYPVDYLPLNNTAAQPILEEFIHNITELFGMQVKRFNFTAMVQNVSDPIVANLTARNDDVLNIIDYHPQWEEIAQPLITAWAEEFDGRFPPVDKAYRDPWSTWNTTTGSTLAEYSEAVRRKRKAVDWYEENLQFSKGDACSESVMMYD